MKELNLNEANGEGTSQENQPSLPKAWKNVKNHPLEQVIGDVEEEVKTRRALLEYHNHFAFMHNVNQRIPKKLLKMKVG